MLSWTAGSRADDGSALPAEAALPDTDALVPAADAGRVNCSLEVNKAFGPPSALALGSAGVVHSEGSWAVDAPGKAAKSNENPAVAAVDADGEINPTTADAVPSDGPRKEGCAARFLSEGSLSVPCAGGGADAAGAVAPFADRLAVVRDGVLRLTSAVVPNWMPKVGVAAEEAATEEAATEEAAAEEAAAADAAMVPKSGLAGAFESAFVLSPPCMIAGGAP